jgi:hypothetical protein
MAWLDEHRIRAIVHASLAAMTGAAGWFLSLPDRPVAVVGVSLALTTMWEVALSARMRTTLRRQADAWIESAGGRFIPPHYSWRVAELLSGRERRALARSLRGLVRQVTSRLPDRNGLVVRSRVVPHIDVLLDIAERLEDRSTSVRPAGIIALRHVLCDTESPLYVSDADLSSVELAAALTAVVLKLDGDRTPDRRDAVESSSRAA